MDTTGGESAVVAADSLTGFTIGVTAERRREELGNALARHGARVLYGPAIRIVPLADDSQLLAATRQVIAAPPDLAVATTGVGFRGWVEAAAQWGMSAQLLGALGTATILARGPKVRGAVRAAGLRETWSPESESSAEVLAHLLEHHQLRGRRIAVQLHGEPLRDLVDTLRAAGAEVIEVPVYRWVPPEDEGPLRRVIEATAARRLDAVAFTSAPAAVNFLRTAAALDADVVGALSTRVLCMAVGPVTAFPLEQAGIVVSQPARARLGALARELVETLPRRATVVRTAGHRLEVRGTAVLVDDVLVAVPAAGMALLRELATAGGRVLSRRTLLDLLPGDSLDGHAVEAAVGRLRSLLGDPAIIETVVKRGYRLRVDTP